MKAPLSWLKEFVSIDVPLEDLTHRLTMGGTEVAGVEQRGADWTKVVVGFVESVRPHPNADRLRLVTVDAGSGAEAVEVVCGAPNVAAGQKIAYASVGANLIDAHTGQARTLKRAKIRGVVSEGMVCSERELGLGDNHEGILVLNESAPVGAPLGEILGDAVLDLELTPNRPDCLGVLGVAREIAALTGVSASEPDLSYPEEGPDAKSLASIRIDAPDLCRRYTATVLQGVKLGPSPKWLVDRLAAVGQGSINNVVDVTNYVMFELGQPLHAFDLDAVADHAIVVRRALRGETLVTLDDVERKLPADALLIADPGKGIGLAGVMGGANSEISERTANVLLESATFEGPNNRRTAAALGMRTEATLRFEKGLRPELAEIAVRRATKLILEIAGGTAARGILDAWPGRDDIQTEVHVSAEKLERILGVRFSDEQIRDTLQGLGFGVRTVGDVYAVSIPYWRPDVTIPEDVAEEVARVIGYDKVPTRTISGAIPQWEPQPEHDLREQVRAALVAAGLQETISYPLTTEEELQQPLSGTARPNPLKLVNPVASDHSALRTTLRGSVLKTVARNVRTWRGPIALFELGRTYLHWGEGQVDERETVAGALTGARVEPQWNADPGELDFYDAKGAVEAVISELGLEASFEPHEDPSFSKGRCASVLVGNERVGVVGEVANSLLDAFECDVPKLALFELDLPMLLEASSGQAGAPVRYKSFSRFPDAIRDLAVVVDQSIPAGELVRIVQRSRLVQRVVVFDVYRGEGIEPNQKSVALRVHYQAGNRTLAADDISKAETATLRALEREVGAKRRA